MARWGNDLPMRDDEDPFIGYPDEPDQDMAYDDAECRKLWEEMEER